jgi:hypothetical protein
MWTWFIWIKISLVAECCVCGHLPLSSVTGGESWQAKQLSAIQERIALTKNQRNYTNLNKDRLVYRILAYLGKHALILDHIFISCEKNVEFCGTHLTLYLPSHARWAFVCNQNHSRCPFIELQNPVGKCAAKTSLLVNQKCILSRTAPLAVFSWNNS